jgi:hypothetical protein
MLPRKKRPSPKSDQASYFLQTQLARGPKPANDVKKAACARGISVYTLTELARGLIKTRQKGPDGKTKSYWSLPDSWSWAGKTPATVRKDSAEFIVGYTQALGDMQWKLKSICSAMSGKKGQDLYSKLHAALSSLVPDVE